MLTSDYMFNSSSSSLISMLSTYPLGSQNWPSDTFVQWGHHVIIAAKCDRTIIKTLVITRSLKHLRSLDIADHLFIQGLKGLFTEKCTSIPIITNFFNNFTMRHLFDLICKRFTQGLWSDSTKVSGKERVCLRLWHTSVCEPGKKRNVMIAWQSSPVNKIIWLLADNKFCFTRMLGSHRKRKIVTQENNK